MFWHGYDLLRLAGFLIEIGNGKVLKTYFGEECECGLSWVDGVIDKVAMDAKKKVGVI